MRYIFIALTIALIIIGFHAKLAWIGAAITAILAVISPRPNVKEDLATNTGKIFNDLRHVGAEGQTVRDCPFCLQKIKAEARKCPHCGEWVEPTKGYKICSHCGAKNKVEAFQCKECQRAI